MNPSDSKAPKTCRLLRTKSPLEPLLDNRVSWETGHCSTAVYWCLMTMESSGPDDRLAHAHDCSPQRTCFKCPEKELDEENAEEFDEEAR